MTGATAIGIAELHSAALGDAAADQQRQVPLGIPGNWRANGQFRRSHDQHDHIPVKAQVRPRTRIAQVWMRETGCDVGGAID